MVREGMEGDGGAARVGLDGGRCPRGLRGVGDDPGTAVGRSLRAKSRPHRDAGSLAVNEPDAAILTGDADHDARADA